MGRADLRLPSWVEIVLARQTEVQEPERHFPSSHFCLIPLFPVCSCAFRNKEEEKKQKKHLESEMCARVLAGNARLPRR